MAAAPHSTYLEVVNAICYQVGLPTIKDTAKFDAKTGLQRPHLLLMSYVDDADAKLVIRLTELFTTRKFIAATVAGTKEFDVNDLTDLEGVKYHSMRCITNGYQRNLNFIPKHIWDELNPNRDSLETGSPQSWTYFDPPEEDGLEQTTRQVVLYPVPDASYQIEYSAKVNHRTLSVSTDKILWPKNYEHVLQNWGRAMLEEKLGTGDYTSYAQAALDNLRQWATGAADNVKKVNMGGAAVGRETNFRSNNGNYWFGGRDDWSW